MTVLSSDVSLLENNGKEKMNKTELLAILTAQSGIGAEDCKQVFILCDISVYLKILQAWMGFIFYENYQNNIFSAFI